MKLGSPKFVTSTHTSTSKRRKPADAGVWRPSLLINSNGTAVSASDSLRGTRLDPALAKGIQALLIVSDADGVMFTVGNHKQTYCEILSEITGLPSNFLYKRLLDYEISFKKQASEQGLLLDGHQINTDAFIALTNEAIKRSKTSITQQDIIRAGRQHRTLRTFDGVIESLADAQDLAFYAGLTNKRDPSTATVMPYLIFNSCGQVGNLLGMTHDTDIAGIIGQELVPTAEGILNFIGVNFMNGKPVATQGKVFTNKGKGQFLEWIETEFLDYLNSNRRSGGPELSVDMTYLLDGETDNEARQVVPVSISVYEPDNDTAADQMFRMRHSRPSQISNKLRANQTVRGSRLRHHPCPVEAVWSPKATQNDYKQWMDGLRDEDLRQGKLDLTHLPEDSPARQAKIVAVVTRSLVLRGAYLAGVPVKEYAPVDLGLMPGKALALRNEMLSNPGLVA